MSPSHSQNELKKLSEHFRGGLPRVRDHLGGYRMQEPLEIHRLVGFEEILQNLHPQQVKILKIITHEGVTKSEIVDLLGIDRKSATEQLAVFFRWEIL